MKKECPHCHVDDFTLRDLFALDYFRPSECRNCGGLIRNSGWSQFLGPATTLVWFLILVTAFRFLPEWLVIWILIATIALPWLIFAKPVKADTPRADLPPYTADPHNDKSLIVRGWGEPELSRILADFTGQDSSAAKPLINISKVFEREYRLTFPGDIHPFDYLALINYLHYPIDVDIHDHTIVVVGKTTLTSDFQGIPESVIGKKALIYVPKNDQSFDEVFVETTTGVKLKYCFSEQVWHASDEERMPQEVKMLSNL